MMRFDRFTESAQEAAQRAIEILQRYEQNQVDTEHILMGLIEKPDAMIEQILDELDVSGKTLCDRLDYLLGFIRIQIRPGGLLDLVHVICCASECSEVPYVVIHESA